MSESMTAQDLVSTLEKIGTCMMTTVDADGRLVSRPMSVAAIDDRHHFWFFSGIESEEVDDIVGKGQVNLSFVEDRTWVSVAGHASVSTDEAKKAQLWELGAEAYFAEGPEDAEAAVIQVEPESAQYWQAPGTPRALIKMARASLSRERPDMGDQGRVQL